MIRTFDFKVVLFFIVLTVLMTIGVIVFWEEVLRPPFFAWVEARYPGAAYAQFRWNIQQRVEHFFHFRRGRCVSGDTAAPSGAPATT